MKFNDMKQHDANDWKSRLGMVYSTDPDFRYTTDEVEEPETLPPDKQTLRVWLDRKQRAGRVVTLVRGFRGTAADLEALGGCSNSAAASAGRSRRARSSSRATTATASSRSCCVRATAARRREDDTDRKPDDRPEPNRTG